MHSHTLPSNQSICLAVVSCVQTSRVYCLLPPHSRLEANQDARAVVLGDCLCNKELCTPHHLCHFLSSSQGWGESGTSCAPLSPLLRQTPQFYWRKCFLLTTILSFNLYPLSFFLVFLNLEENLSLISLSPFVTSVSPQYNPDPNGGAEEGYGKPFERNRSA